MAGVARLIRLGVLLLPLLLTSCRTFVPLTERDEWQIPTRFNASLPTAFTARQTLVFEFRPHWWWPPVRFTALGYATVDRAARDYAVVCLSPLGMKLFEVSCAGGRSQATLAFPIPGNGDAIGKAIGADIANLYFDLVPAPGAALRRRGDVLRFREARDGLRLTHEFSIPKGRLLRKTVDDKSGRTTIVFGDPEGDLVGGYPGVVRLRNHRYGYQVTVRTRQLEAMPGQRERND
jgi:hypothetical protein